jgi:hypothetical protein
MAVMLSKTYDALIAAGVPEDKARAAVEEPAGYESRFAKIETDLAVLKRMLGVVLTGVGSLVVSVGVLLVKAFSGGRYSSALMISSHIFLASPNSIIVLSR